MVNRIEKDFIGRREVSDLFEFISLRNSLPISIKYWGERMAPVTGLRSGSDGGDSRYHFCRRPDRVCRYMKNRTIMSYLMRQKRLWIMDQMGGAREAQYA